MTSTLGIVPTVEMFPFALQFIIAMVAYAINERMARRVDYLLEEVRVLREVYGETTGRKRISFTDEQRRRLAIKGKALTPDEREGCCQIVRPSTLLVWFRQLVAKKYDSSTRRKKPGRPRKADEIRELVIKLARENLGWGYTKMQCAFGAPSHAARALDLRATRPLRGLRALRFETLFEASRSRSVVQQWRVS